MLHNEISLYQKSDLFPLKIYFNDQNEKPQPTCSLKAKKAEIFKK